MPYTNTITKKGAQNSPAVQLTLLFLQESKDLLLWLMDNKLKHS